MREGDGAVLENVTVCDLVTEEVPAAYGVKCKKIRNRGKQRCRRPGKQQNRNRHRGIVRMNANEASVFSSETARLDVNRGSVGEEFSITRAMSVKVENGYSGLRFHLCAESKVDGPEDPCPIDIWQLRRGFCGL